MYRYSPPTHPLDASFSTIERAFRGRIKRHHCSVVKAIPPLTLLYTVLVVHLLNMHARTPTAAMLLCTAVRCRLVGRYAGQSTHQSYQQLVPVPLSVASRQRENLGDAGPARYGLCSAFIYHCLLTNLSVRHQQPSIISYS